MDFQLLEEFSQDDLMKIEELEELLANIDNSPQPSTSHKQDSARFSVPLSTKDFQTNLQNRIPQKTQQASNWAVSIYKEWRTWRNYRQETRSDPNWPIPSLDSEDLESLDYWLARFITEIRKQDKADYPPGKHKMSTLYIQGISTHFPYFSQI